MRVTTFDVCQPGFERMRSQSEFILLAYPRAGDTPAQLRDEWKADLQSCARPDGFDYDAALAAIDAFCDAEQEWLASACADAPESAEDEELTAYLFISGGE